MHSFVLRDVAALDPSGGFDGPLDVVVEDGTIAAVGRRARAPEDAVEVDCSGLWLMPGIFDCHCHVAVSSFSEAELLRTPITLRTLETARNLQRTLEAGVTFVRDAGGADAGVRDAVRQGFVAGPELQVSVVMLSQTGGHGDGFLAGPGIELSNGYMIPDYPGRPPFLVDGVDSMRRVVRTVLRAGADCVKVCTTGGVFGGAEAAGAAQLSLDEVRTAVLEAKRRNRPVLAHALGGEGIDIALEAGVRSIEHGIFLDERQAAEMARRETFLVPTLSIYAELARLADEGQLPPAVASAALAIRRELGQAVRIAADHGVKIAVGSDFASRDQHGRNLEEIALLHEAGLPTGAALLAATAVGAELCGVGDRLGRLAPGLVFDALLLDDDPSDPAIFRRPGSVTGVFKAGAELVPHARVQEALGRKPRKEGAPSRHA